MRHGMVRSKQGEEEGEAPRRGNRRCGAHHAEEEERAERYDKDDDQGEGGEERCAAASVEPLAQSGHDG